MAFGIVLARLRRARGWSQEKLAHKADLSQRHLSFLETGRSLPGPSALAKLTRAMALMGWEQRALMASLALNEDRDPGAPIDTVLPNGFFGKAFALPRLRVQA